MLDIVGRQTPYAVGDVTHYGKIVAIAPPIVPFLEDADQSVIVKLDPASLSSLPNESLLEKPPTSYMKIELFPIRVDMVGLSDDAPPTGTQAILAAENLTIEDVSPLIKSNTFSLWKEDCSISKDTADDLARIKFSIVHRYSSPSDQNNELDSHSTELVNMAVACLALIRPTRRGQARNVRGHIRVDGLFDPQGFSSMHAPAEVPEIQKLFAIRKKDVDDLSSILPEFIQLYQKNDQGGLKDDYEPLRMAVQLYEQAYELSYWKARHILWWSAIEAIYGNNEDAAFARIYALFGNKNLADGYRCPIYEKGDIPSCYHPPSSSIHKLGEMVPLIYAVRNASAHGQKVPDTHFTKLPHPFGPAVVGVDVLAEAATFIIRKTVIQILQQGWKDRFKDRDGREDFWLYQYGLDKKQSQKRLREMYESLGIQGALDTRKQPRKR
jgi:hypothetical protein